jgi:hypothetical protein
MVIHEEQMGTLDLHGVRHADVRRKVIRFIEGGWSDPSDSEIITGYSKRMQELVTEVLDEYKLPYTVGTELDPYAPKITVWGGDEV